MGLKAQSRVEHDRGLLLIGLFKLCKAIFFFSIGVGAMRLLHNHKDLSDEVQQVAAAMHFDTESHFVTLLMSKADIITPHRLKQIGIGTFLYSGLALTEGIGLVLEKVWAEYLTLSLTIAFLPWEIYELVVGYKPFKVALLVFNILILAYLILVTSKKRSST